MAGLRERGEVKTIAAMPGKRKIVDVESRELPKNYITAWRLFRGKMSVEKLAAKSGLSGATISNAANGKVDVTGKTLKQLADALETTPGALLEVDPRKAVAWWELWDQMRSPKDRERAISVVSELVKDR